MEGMVIFFMTSQTKMKNSYRFEKLIKSELGPTESREDIYSMMQNPILYGDMVKIFDSLADMKSYLNSDCYYVAHNLTARKGKKTIFKGRLYKAKKDDLLNFIFEAIDSDELRELLISPIQAHQKRKVFYCSEDVFYMYTEKQV